MKIGPVESLLLELLICRADVTSDMKASMSTKSNCLQVNTQNGKLDLWKIYCESFYSFFFFL